MRSIGRIIAENRKKKGLSQPELAELLSQQGIDVTAKAISKWETNAREPGLHVFLTLCKLLDIEDIYDASIILTSCVHVVITLYTFSTIRRSPILQFSGLQ